MIQRKDPVKRQKTRQQRTQPQNAWRNYAVQIGPRPDGEGDQHNDDQKKRKA